MPPLLSCRNEGYETSVNYELQQNAGAIWRWGLVGLSGQTCDFGSDCSGFL